MHPAEFSAPADKGGKIFPERAKSAGPGGKYFHFS